MNPQGGNQCYPSPHTGLGVYPTPRPPGRTYPPGPSAVQPTGRREGQPYSQHPVHHTAGNRSTCTETERKVFEDEDEEDTEDSGISADSMEPSDNRQSQLTATLNWLTENYEWSEGVCLPRCTLYAHYQDFCKKQVFSPAGAATFGKILRQRFPKLTTRRLGTRGQSKYHYYGIGIKETSIYYHSVYTGKGLTRFSGTKIKTEGSSRKYSLSSKTGTLLPEFPDACHLVLPEGMDADKVQTFIMMYRTHCQRILDTVISANFEEVQNFLLHFWQGMPEHLVDLLDKDITADIVGICDSVLYKVLTDVLVPSTIQDLPDSLGGEIKAFVKCLPGWLNSALEGLPETLRTRKLQVVHSYVLSIRRQISFVHLAQTARSVLLSQDTVSQMVIDLSELDLPRLCCQAAYINPKHRSKTAYIINNYFNEFKALLMTQATIESFTEWFDNVIDTSILQTEGASERSFQDDAAEFILLWSACSSLVLRDLTLHSAKSFGPFHLLHMMFLEYVFLVVDTQQASLRERQLTTSLATILKNPESVTMDTKIRHSGRNQMSPRTKRRRVGDDTSDGTVTDDESVKSDCNARNKNISLHPKKGAPTYNNHTGNDRHQRYAENLAHPEDPNQISLPQEAFSSSPGKEASGTTGSGSCNRNSYMNHLPISYAEYMPTSTSIQSPRGPGMLDAIHSQGFNLNSGMLPASSVSFPTHPSSSYWNEHQRAHTGFSDHFSNYPAYKPYPASYDTFNRSGSGAIFRPPCYQDAHSRSTFDHTRGLYPIASHEAISGGPGLAMTSYSGNYLDMAASGGSYTRQEGMGFSAFHQEEYLPANISGTFSNIAKSYIAPFR